MSQENPWKTLSSKIVYQNPWISVREDQVIRPDGNPGIYGVLDKSVATGVVAIDNSNNVYLVGQYRYTTEQYSWEIVEGGVEQGETPLEAIRRELKEEAGLIADNWIKLGGGIQISNCVTSEIGYLYLASGLSEIESDPEPTEVLEVKAVPFEQALKMVYSGEITDAMSIIGLTLAKAQLSDL